MANGRLRRPEEAIDVWPWGACWLGVEHAKGMFQRWHLGLANALKAWQTAGLDPEDGLNRF